MRIGQLVSASGHECMRIVKSTEKAPKAADGPALKDYVRSPFSIIYVNIESEFR